MGYNAQERFTRGNETRLQPNREKRDFQGLLDYERELVVLTEALSAKVTPEVAAEIMRRPETVVDYPHVAGDLSSIKLVCFQVALHANDLYSKLTDATRHR
jgi:hypothetical protein